MKPKWILSKVNKIEKFLEKLKLPTLGMKEEHFCTSVYFKRYEHLNYVSEFDSLGNMSEVLRLFKTCK